MKRLILSMISRIYVYFFVPLIRVYYRRKTKYTNTGKIALCCIAKQENEYIRFFVEYYKNLNFDKIIIYDNNEPNGERFEEVISDYIQSGFVALTFLSCYNNRLTKLDVSKNTALTSLSCDINQLTKLDVSNNTALTSLSCSDNQLTTLDVSMNNALTSLSCYTNQLTTLDVTKNAALTSLVCHNNRLTTLDVSKNTSLTFLSIYRNNIKGEEMDKLIISLPKYDSNTVYQFRVISSLLNNDEGNVCTESQVAAVKAKGWTPMYYNGNEWVEYFGGSGIQGVVLEEKMNSPIYDLNGRQLNKPLKGINIIGGKKVVVK